MDFNEVFFTDVARARREPRRSAQRWLGRGQRVARPRAHDDVAGLRRPDRQHDRRLPADDARSSATSTPRRSWTTRRCGCWARSALAKAARGEVDVASVSVLKLFGSEAEMHAIEQRADRGGARRADPSVDDGPVRAHEPRPLLRELVRALRPQLRAAPSPAAPRRSSATSSPSRCSACRGADPVTESLLVERPRAGVLLVTLNRPQRLNAINEVLRRRTHRDAAHRWTTTSTPSCSPAPDVASAPASTCAISGPGCPRPTHPRSTGCGSRSRWPRCRRRSGICRNPSSPRSTGRASAPDSRCVWPPTSGSVRRSQRSETRAILLGLSGAEMGMSYHLPANRRNQRRRRLDADGPHRDRGRSRPPGPGQRARRARRA